MLVIFALFIVAVASGVGTTRGQSGPPKLVLRIEVLSVDLATDTAQVDVNITIDGPFLRQIANFTSEQPLTAVVESDFDSLEIPLNDNISYYGGSSENVSWTLGGELGKGEYFPFEKYELTFRVDTIRPVCPNMTELKMGPDDADAYFAGPNKMLLARIFQATPSQDRASLSTYSVNTTTTVDLSRKLSALGYPIFFWQLILPTMAGYWLLATTLFSGGKKARRDRLTVCLSLFFFCPTFLLAMQGYLPLRASLSIPEVLIVTLVVGAAILAVSSLLPANNDLTETFEDMIMLFLASGSALKLLLLLLPTIPVSAFNIFFYGVMIPYYLVALFPIIRRFRDALYERLDRENRTKGLIGGVLMTFGLIFCTLMAISMYALIPGVPMLGLGILLIVLSRRSKPLSSSNYPPFGFGIV